jgi:hypothetical protein
VRWPLAVVALVACGPNHGGGPSDGSGGPDAFAGPFPDFPAQPIVDTGTPSDVPGLFGDPATGAASGGPCIVEPEVNTLYPNNWLRPRFTWIATGTENVFELRLTAANQINPLIVYTNATSWTMPGAIWDALAAHTVDQPIMMSVRGATYSNGMLTSLEHGTAGPIAIAPVPAPGAIVYWTTSAGTVLRGFHIGDETVTDIIHPADVSGSACVGCHSSTPDGVFVGFSSSPVANNGDPATLAMQSADGMHSTPPYISASAQTLMARQQQELPTYSKLHWQPGDRVAMTMYQSQIMWTDLEATSTAQGAGWDFLARAGETNGAAYASFAHTTDTVLYVTAPTVSSGVTVTAGDIATVPFNNRAGGTPQKVLGADTGTYNEYYPMFSPDDKYIAYNRVANGASSYNNGQAEVFAIVATGGTPIRLVANDPPACSGRTSPGVTNSWPKWSPEATDAGTRRFYWLTFSSTRSTGGNPQLYVTPLVDDNGTVTTYPALYLWNQPAAENNHTPAWDNFGILE